MTFQSPAVAAPAASTLPTVCPACQSASIGTRARTPDENAYWHCDACGEVWNAGRRKVEPNGRRRW